MLKILRYSPVLIALVALLATACGGGTPEGLAVTPEAAVDTAVPEEPTVVAEATQPPDSVVKVRRSSRFCQTRPAAYSGCSEATLQRSIHT